MRKRIAFGALSLISAHFLRQFCVLSFFNVFWDFRKLNSIWNCVFSCLWHPGTSLECSRSKLGNVKRAVNRQPGYRAGELVEQIQAKTKMIFFWSPEGPRTIPDWFLIDLGNIIFSSNFSFFGPLMSTFGPQKLICISKLWPIWACRASKVIKCLGTFWKSFRSVW